MEDTRHNINHLTPGIQLCGGKYVIEKKIGEGGFGITYRAVQKGLNRAVCIKEFFPAGRCMRDPSTRFVYAQGVDESLFNKYRQAFKHEAETLAKLQHPGIVEVIEIFDENNTTYMVMPFVEGRTLQQMVEQQGPLPYPEAVNYIAQIAEAVAYLHKNHILHRDIKPSNIIVTAEYRTVLIDFGSAREFINDKTQAHTSILTHGYAPTEQYSTTSRKGSYTDIYAIGATLYFVLTGQVPMDAATRMNEEMPEPRSINSSIPNEANRTILKAMQMKAADRYQNVQEFMDDLCNAQPSRTTTPKPSSPTVSQPSEKRRSSTALFIILGILGLAITVVIASLILSHRVSDRADDDALETVKAPETPDNIIEETPIESKEEELARYQQIYADYIRTNYNVEDFVGWKFIYVDEDNVPEMILPTGSNAGGCLLLSYYNGRVQDPESSLSPYYFEYIPYKNRVMSISTRDGFEYYGIGELRGGVLYYIADVFVNYHKDYERNEIIYSSPVYTIGNREVSESEAKNCIQRMFYDLGQKEVFEDYNSLRPMSDLWRKSSPGEFHFDGTLGDNIGVSIEFVVNSDDVAVGEIAYTNPEKPIRFRLVGVWTGDEYLLNEYQPDGSVTGCLRMKIDDATYYKPVLTAGTWTNPRNGQVYEMKNMESGYMSANNYEFNDLPAILPNSRSRIKPPRVCTVCGQNPCICPKL